MTEASIGFSLSLSAIAFIVGISQKIRFSAGNDNISRIVIKPTLLINNNYTFPQSIDRKDERRKPLDFEEEID